MYPVSLSDAERSAIPNVHWTPDGDRGEIDSETAILLRACLRPLFERAETWAGLLAELAGRDYALKLRQGRLMLVNTQTRTAICTGSFLGVPFRSLVDRLGRPGVVVEAADQMQARLVA